MEAPEKIYVSTDPFGCLHAYDCENHPPIVEEYIHKDAFIKNIYEWLRKGGSGWYLTSEFGENTIDFVKLAEDFKKYMKGE